MKSQDMINLTAPHATTGPWHFSPTLDETTEILADSDHPASLVATVHTDADARLIAAAPDLFRACALILARLDVEAETEDIFPGNTLRADLRDALDRAR